MIEAATMDATRETRTIVLEPTIRQMVQVLRGQTDQVGALRLAVKQFTVEVSAWERSLILEAYDAGSPTSVDLAFRLAEAVAVQAKGLNDLVRLAGEPPAPDEPRTCSRDDLVMDYAIGSAIHAEFAQSIEEMDAGGRRGPARNLLEVDGRLARNLQIIRDGLHEDEINTAGVMASEMQGLATGKAAATAPRADSMERGGPATGRTADGLADHRPKGLRRLVNSRVKQLAAAGVITGLIVACVMLLWPALTEKKDLESGLRYVSGIESYTGAPPALTVRVSSIHWDSLDQAGRMAWVWGVVVAAERSGFSRAEILTPDGKTVAKWAKNGRIALF